MRTFKTKPFVRFASREGIADDELCKTVAQIESGIIDADLGGGVLKQRIARKGAGKSGGYRSIILFRQTTHMFFVFGFAKSSQANIRADELKGFRHLADELLALNGNALQSAQANGTITEINCNG